MQYLSKSQMSDAATIDAEGKRTVPSILLKTTMVTGDSIENVLAFYRKLLTRNPTNDGRLGIGRQVGRSVVFSDEFDERSFPFHTIVVNAANTSKILIITRGDDEKLTRITWNAILET